MGSTEALSSEAHVWIAALDEIRDPGQLQSCEALLSSEERARRDRFYFPEGRHEFLVSHALVRSVLSGYADVDPKDWSFGKNQYGCPAIAGPTQLPPLRFNLSHTHGLVACAVTLTRDLGVDVEDTWRRGRTVEIADRYFSSAETAALRALPQAAQRDRFFQYWTLKESYIKARGMGLSIPLDQFSFELDQGAVGIRIDPRLADDAERWQFALHRPTARHQLAIAIDRGRGRAAPDLEVRYRQWGGCQRPRGP